ncbi:probable protein phosphatase 2C 48 isoform X2 [Malania oleifera]|uniref:probable protein phosphatase 2C 48 isoform X2 n=1 Tax=Malania oleifera TaxID=397392 RepID=UPI0025AEB677|nr:probable protein phosphatase 2C 48 isoform X2 [Malania oleifera]
MVKTCWKSYISRERTLLDGDTSPQNRDSAGQIDGLLWYKDLGHLVHGEFSMAAVEANRVTEDQSQLESGPLSSIRSGPSGTFIGIYDGHGGPEASQFISDNLFNNLKKFASEHKEISENVIKKAYSKTEEDFFTLVKDKWLSLPAIASTGSCCLVGIIYNGLLYVANVGDSRMVLGRVQRPTQEAIAIQLSTEHSLSIESVREELRSLHPNDPQIVVYKHKVWRVKGIIQISRSIGDAYLKRPEFNKEPLYTRFRLTEPFEKPILGSEPSIVMHKLHPEDQFLIFASDGLWEYLSNQDAVNIVQNFARNGIAKKLIKAALQEAARKREMRYSDLRRIDKGVEDLLIPSLIPIFHLSYTKKDTLFICSGHLYNNNNSPQSV